jgi:hypothetical protein
MREGLPADPGLDWETKVMAILLLLLPILWALVGTGVGLLLYKTSAALFESTERSETKTKRIRATGSVVIAGAAFCGMWRATPSDLAQQASKLGEQAREVDRASLAVAACDASACQQACSREVTDLRAKTTELVSATGPR